jgi:hypothetical protein
MVRIKAVRIVGIKAVPPDRFYGRSLSDRASLSPTEPIRAEENVPALAAAVIRAGESSPTARQASAAPAGLNA